MILEYFICITELLFRNKSADSLDGRSRQPYFLKALGKGWFETVEMRDDQIAHRGLVFVHGLTHCTIGSVSKGA